MISQDEKYMKMALKQARRGVGNVEPNPAVGCIIKKSNQIIGKGYHRKFGEPHAEIVALDDCGNLGVNPRGATMYVTLEPCSHHGKTPPCTDAIIAAGLGEVFVATTDPSEYANGKGIEQMRNAGIDVHVGLCETEARLLNAPFMKYASTGRSWVILKWAQSLDGKLALTQQDSEAHYAKKRPGWISNELSRKDVHRLRRQSQAILVGINTVLADNPMLTPRPSRGSKPCRVVLDSSLRIPMGSRLLRTVKTSPVLIFTSQQAAQSNTVKTERIAKKGAEWITFPETCGRSNLYFVIEELSRRGVTQLLVEGGPTVIASFLKENLADEIYIYFSPRILGREGSAEIAGPIAELTASFGLHYVETKLFGDDVCIRGLSEKALRDISIFEEPPSEENELQGSDDSSRAANEA